ncbi:MAG TPA: nucleoside hydrolase, partial [Acidimicrobiales bacterium]|nr:nucleoside hydrolase [Acidimicrobiales bacterium]
MDPRPWVVTCDPGVDDAVALAVAAGRDDCDVRAIVASAGNVDAPTAWRNARGLADLLGLDVPVAMGSAATVGGRAISRAGHAHGADGLAGLAHRL